jgi:8-oxo-dGTP pyrophosphatase MutT (NUDIX family)
MRRYLVGISVYLLDADCRQILLLRRSRTSDFEARKWEPVSGRAEPGEDLEGVARRETFEETRLRVSQLVPFHTFMIERRKEDFLHGVAFLATVRAGTLTISPEHDSSVWVSRQDLAAGRGPKLAAGVESTVAVLVRRWPHLVAQLEEG